MAPSSSYPVLPIFSFLGLLTVLVPAPWQFQAWNAGTCMYIAWTAMSCLIVFVNTIVWRDNVADIAPTWCAFSTKLLIGAGVGIPAAALCIVRRLWIVLSVQSVVMNRRSRFISLVVDLSIALGFPVLIMILHSIVQGHRYDILEQVGCLPTIYNTVPAYFIVYMWPITLGCISFFYSALILHHFFQRRAQFNTIVSGASITPNRYLRLIALACIELVCTIPISAFSMYLNTNGIPLEPYISWDNVHYGFEFVGQYPAEVWRAKSDGGTSVELMQWLYPVCAFLFFVLFGCGEEARRKYMVAFRRAFGLKEDSNDGTTKISDSTLFSRSRADFLSKSATDVTVTTVSETRLCFDQTQPGFTYKSSMGESFMDMTDRLSKMVDIKFDCDLEKGIPPWNSPEYTEKA